MGILDISLGLPCYLIHIQFDFVKGLIFTVQSCCIVHLVLYCLYCSVLGLHSGGVSNVTS